MVRVGPDGYSAHTLAALARITNVMSSELESCSSAGRAPAAAARLGAMIALGLLAAGGTAGIAGAQGSLAGQGFGYPPGQLSSRAAGSAGAAGEVDPLSPINPAALSTWGRAGLSLHYAPEFRTVRAGDGTDRTTTVRFPLIAAAVRVSEKAMLGLSSSALLDRTFSTQSRATSVTSAGDTVNTTFDYGSAGGTNDIRLGGAYDVHSTLALGAGAHVFTGDNRLTRRASFVDSSLATPDPRLGFADSRTLRFGGLAASAGVTWRPTPDVTLAASGRKGGTVRLRTGADTLLSSGKVPDRFGAAVRYDGLRGASLHARIAWDGWSSLAALGSAALDARDAWDASLGAEASGPKFGENVVTLRGGLRQRDLPFAIAGRAVRERSFSLGAGAPLARTRAQLDIGAQRASREATGVGATETAWTLSVGLTVRP